MTVVFVGLPVFLVNNQAAQLVFGLTVRFLALMCYLWFKPYKDNTDNWLQMLAQLCIFLVLLAKIMLTSEDENYGFGVALLVVSLAPAAIVAGSVVMIIAREGAQTAVPEYPFVKATPSWASASICGVCMSEPDAPPP
mgnify:CR=1 FL=1